jgi:flagellar P-ring protein precursor FlgI
MLRCFRYVVLAAMVVGAEGRAEETAATRALVPIADITTVEGVRENSLFGYGLVVGLNGTGDRRQTLFTTQTLASMLARLGVQIPAAAARVNNVAAVMVTATLPAFARPGTHADVTVSSIGDAKSLEGGLLLLTPLYAADGRIYATAQGALTLGGYSAGAGGGNAKQVNHPTVGQIVDGGMIERDTAVDLTTLPRLALLLREPGYGTAVALATAINREVGEGTARAVDGRQVELHPATPAPNLPELLARIGRLLVGIERRARVVVNERTGTVVLGKEVRLGPVSILHGSLSVDIATVFSVSQPAPLSRGQTAVVPQPSVRAEEGAARRVELSEGATVQQLVDGLQAIGATARDVIAILQALKAAGALDAELEVL